MKTVSTRVLLTCAAIGVAGGLVFVITSTAHVFLTATIPLLYGAFLGIYFIPGAIAQALIRLPGVGLITATISGLIAAISPIQASGGKALYIVLVGALQECAYLLLRYRRWPRWPALVSAGVTGVVFAVIFHFAFDIGEHYPVWLAVTQFVLTPAAAVLGSLLGAVIARALAATGAYRPPRR